jgi:hypothetical protein
VIFQAVYFNKSVELIESILIVVGKLFFQIYDQLINCFLGGLGIDLFLVISLQICEKEFSVFSWGQELGFSITLVNFCINSDLDPVGLFLS